MKKALSLALALVMMLSLAPMTAWAASSSMTNALMADGDTNMVNYDGENPYVYTWTPETNGEYTFSFEGNDWVCDITGMTPGSYNSVQNDNVFSHEFYAGVEYQIAIANTSYTQGIINFTLVEGGVAGPTVGGADFYGAAAVTETMEGKIAVTGMESTGYFFI